MANELTILTSFSFSKNGVAVSQSKSKTITVAGTKAIHNVQTIGTSAETINFVDVVPGFVMLINQDSTNYVQIALDVGITENVAKLEAGQSMVWPVDQLPIYAKANAAPVDLQVVACDL